MSDLKEHPFAVYVRTLGRGKRARRALERTEARDAMDMILRDEATDAQLGALLMLLRVKEETPEEVAGFLDSARDDIRQRIDGASLPAVTVDWPCYAGKKKHSPWFLLSAWLLAQLGETVLLHGGPEHTPGRLYTDQLLLKLGGAPATSLADLASQLASNRIAYAPLSLFSPVLHHLLTLRFELGLRSPVNSLARSLNPLSADLSLQSVFHPAYMALHAESSVLADAGRMIVFKGEGGEPEIRPDATTTLVDVENGVIREHEMPAAMERQTPDGPSAQELLTLWQGGAPEVEGQLHYGEQAVIRSLAVALFGLGKTDSLEHAVTLASQHWAERDRSTLPFARIQPAG